MTDSVGSSLSNNTMLDLAHINYDPQLVKQHNVMHEIDIFVGVFYAIFTVVGFIGNTLSGLYFWFVVRKVDIPTVLYRVVTIVDLSTCFTQLPVAISLFANRHPVMFVNYNICVAWRMIFKTQQRYSMYLVLLLSITRTMKIVNPFCFIRKVTIYIALIIYMVYLVTEEIIYMFKESFSYNANEGYCFESTEITIPTEVHDIMYSVELGIPSMIVFFSFVIAVIKINKRSKNTTAVSTVSQKQKYKATMTIVIFTAVFLLFNLPGFINMVLLLVDQYALKNQNTALYQSTFMRYYSFNMSAVLTVLANAAINPVIYVWRMTALQTWLREFPHLKLGAHGVRQNRNFVARNTMNSSLPMAHHGAPRLPRNNEVHLPHALAQGPNSEDPQLSIPQNNVADGVVNLPEKGDTSAEESRV